MQLRLERGKTGRALTKALVFSQSADQFRMRLVFTAFLVSVRVSLLLGSHLIDFDRF